MQVENKNYKNRQTRHIAVIHIIRIENRNGTIIIIEYNRRCEYYYYRLPIDKRKSVNDGNLRYYNDQA